MKRILLAALVSLLPLNALSQTTERYPSGKEDRTAWVKALDKISRPVLSNLSKGTLRKNMPCETRGSVNDRMRCTHLEALGRLAAGIAPWLELGPDNTPEGRLRKEYIDMMSAGIKNAVTPESPDYMSFGKPTQALVDAAFLAQALLRAPNQMWGKLDKNTQDLLITELKRSRAIRPHDNNWLLFASTVEAALLEFSGECDKNRLVHGINKFRNNWYKGDGHYGDGAPFHMDYYNSYVIHPMLVDVLVVMKKHNIEGADFLPLALSRFTRYAEVQERFISPEGTYPVVGRSIAYRFGAFQVLAQASLMKKLPKKVTPPQVRCALTAVIKNQLKSPDNFDKNGWLRIGFNGSQINMSESYISTGSLYLCSFVFLPLGLPSNDSFWSDPGQDWTSKKAWAGIDVGADHAIK